MRALWLLMRTKWSFFGDSADQASPEGQQFDGEVLGLYEVRDGKLARAQMFYFDTVAVASFLSKAMKQSEK